MSKYGYLEVFQKCLGIRDNKSTVPLYLEEKSVRNIRLPTNMRYRYGSTTDQATVKTMTDTENQRTKMSAIESTKQDIITVRFIVMLN